MLFFPGISGLSAQSIQLLQKGKDTSLRGLSVVDDSIAWVSGSKGWTVLSKDGGKIWDWKQIKGYENLDFRDIEGFSASKAIIVSAGTPAVILLTIDAGQSWQEVYRNESKEIFLDGMDFWDVDRGIIYGDPINGQMVILETKDGGMSWQNISARNKIPLIDGEASFAASGTNIRTGKGGKVWIATGGVQSRLFRSNDFGLNWEATKLPIIQGKNSTGPFSIAFYKNKSGVAAGGDFLSDTSRVNNLVLTKNGGRSWLKPQITLFGYRSAIEYLSKNELLASGPKGTDRSLDGGKTWMKLSDQGFHTVRKAKSGNLVILTGGNGYIAIYQD
ncbi:MAG: YCF48-related protein [Daejeonella sp.]|uniref:WD40/YVTN/BNR-like repeat-containing protein n=1 Tax=Daejeonella sp. TaxID=2805397 RepID=UPI0027326046|nr:YCF48-related protein [Daejeonella sp.]MDP3468403.1 YCF48-related protein [Daejeonella sp.]